MSRHIARRVAQTRQHRLYKADLAAHNVRTVFDRAAICTGARNCPAALHVHGCFADVSGTRCDAPEEH